MSLTSESNEKLITKYAKDSPDSDDADSRRNVGGNGSLKKGPWTAAEDAILADYVTRHGEGNWNAVQKHTGLARCGKSCRLRWANHLRPDLKKGAFSPEEENLIINLHYKYGNKWARMATELPGRTDNEIKNYWNTRIKRQERAGLPVYPPEICLQALKENQQKDDTCSFSSGDVRYTDFVPVNNIEFPSVEFKTMELNHPVYSPPFLEVPAISLSGQGLHSSSPNKPLHSMLHPSKRLRGSDTFNPDLRQYHNINYVQNGQSFMYSPTYDQNLTSNEASSSSVIDGNQYQNAILNGNPSSSEPVWAMKMELPSDQTQVDNWGSPSSPLPPLRSVDTLIQTPLTEHALSCHLSRQSSGLLDDVLHESQTMGNPRNSSHHVMDDNSSQVIRETAWDPYGELTSPLGHSSSFSGDSFDEPETVASSLQGFGVKQEATIWNPMQYEGTVEMTNQMFSRPDLLKDRIKNNGDVHDWNSMFTT